MLLKSAMNFSLKRTGVLYIQHKGGRKIGFVEADSGGVLGERSRGGVESDFTSEKYVTAANCRCQI